VEITLRPLTADVDLYVSLSSPSVSSSVFDFSSTAGGTAIDVVNITRRALPAQVYIAVFGFRASGYTLTARLIAAPFSVAVSPSALLACSGAAEATISITGSAPSVVDVNAENPALSTRLLLAQAVAPSAGVLRVTLPASLPPTASSTLNACLWTIAVNGSGATVSSPPLCIFFRRVVSASSSSGVVTLQAARLSYSALLRYPAASSSLISLDLLLASEPAVVVQSIADGAFDTSSFFYRFDPDVFIEPRTLLALRLRYTSLVLGNGTTIAGAALPDECREALNTNSTLATPLVLNVSGSLVGGDTLRSFVSTDGGGTVRVALVARLAASQQPQTNLAVLTVRALRRVGVFVSGGAPATRADKASNFADYALRSPAEASNPSERAVRRAIRVAPNAQAGPWDVWHIALQDLSSGLSASCAVELRSTWFVFNHSLTPEADAGAPLRVAAGQPFELAWSFATTPADATVNLTIADASGAPVAGWNARPVTNNGSAWVSDLPANFSGVFTVTAAVRSVQVVLAGVALGPIAAVSGAIDLRVQRAWTVTWNAGGRGGNVNLTLFAASDGGGRRVVLRRAGVVNVGKYDESADTFVGSSDEAAVVAEARGGASFVWQVQLAADDGLSGQLAESAPFAASAPSLSVMEPSRLSMWPSAGDAPRAVAWRLFNASWAAPLLLVLLRDGAPLSPPYSLSVASSASLTAALPPRALAVGGNYTLLAQTASGDDFFVTEPFSVLDSTLTVLPAAPLAFALAASNIARSVAPVVIVGYNASSLGGGAGTLDASITIEINGSDTPLLVSDSTRLTQLAVPLPPTLPGVQPIVGGVINAVARVRVRLFGPAAVPVADSVSAPITLTGVQRYTELANNTVINGVVAQSQYVVYAMRVLPYPLTYNITLQPQAGVDVDLFASDSFYTPGQGGSSQSSTAGSGTTDMVTFTVSASSLYYVSAYGYGPSGSSALRYTLTARAGGVALDQSGLLLVTPGGSRTLSWSNFSISALVLRAAPGNAVSASPLRVAVGPRARSALVSVAGLPNGVYNVSIEPIGSAPLATVATTLSLLVGNALFTFNSPAAGATMRVWASGLLRFRYWSALTETVTLLLRNQASGVNVASGTLFVAAGQNMGSLSVSSGLSCAACALRATVGGVVYTSETFSVSALPDTSRVVRARRNAPLSVALTPEAPHAFVNISLAGLSGGRTLTLLATTDVGLPPLLGLSCSVSAGAQFPSFLALGSSVSRTAGVGWLCGGAVASTYTGPREAVNVTLTVSVPLPASLVSFPVAFTLPLTPADWEEQPLCASAGECALVARLERELAAALFPPGVNGTGRLRVRTPLNASANSTSVRVVVDVLEADAVLEELDNAPTASARELASLLVAALNNSGAINSTLLARVAGPGANVSLLPAEAVAACDVDPRACEPERSPPTGSSPSSSSSSLSAGAIAAIAVGAVAALIGFQAYAKRRARRKRDEEAARRVAQRREQPPLADPPFVEPAAGARGGGGGGYAMGVSSSASSNAFRPPPFEALAPVGPVPRPYGGLVGDAPPGWTAGAPNVYSEYAGMPAGVGLTVGGSPRFDLDTAPPAYDPPPWAPEPGKC
jgi:hypothetical protein